MLEIKKYTYTCDGGGVALVNSKGPRIRLINDLGDGDHTLYVMRASGWGPAHYNDRREYEEYERFLESGWKDINISIQCPYPHRGGKEEFGTWKVMFYDLDDYYQDGVELEDGYYRFYHRVVVKGGSGTPIDCQGEYDTEELDSQILVVVYPH